MGALTPFLKSQFQVLVLGFCWQGAAISEIYSHDSGLLFSLDYLTHHLRNPMVELRAIPANSEDGVELPGRLSMSWRAISNS